MGLMCSLRGHDWSETELEDERDERGNEVVLTVREYEVCSRCDARNLVSENTEVTAVANATDDEADEAAADDGEAVATSTAEDEDEADDTDPVTTADEPVEPTGDAAGGSADEDAVVEDDDAAIIVDAEDGEADDAGGAAEPAAEEPAAATDEPATSGTIDTAVADEDATVLTDESADDGGDEAADVGGTDDAPAPGDASDPHADPQTDDGVILPGDEEPPAEDERGHGEWPEHEQAGADGAADETTEWPEHDADDGGYDARQPDEEAADVEFGDGLAPEAATEPAEGTETVEPEPGHDAEFVDDATGRAPEQDREEEPARRQRAGETGIASASEVTAPSEGTTTSADAQLVCPACGNAESRSRTSLRAGDICPECKRGYLAEADE